MDHGAWIALLIKLFEWSLGNRGLLDPLEREEWIMKVNVGDKINTNRRKGAVVLRLIGRGWADVRTVQGNIISVSLCDVTRVW